MQPQKLDKKTTPKPLLELERRLRITKRMVNVMNGHLIVICREASEGRKLRDDVKFYTSVTYTSINDKPYWIIEHQFDARPILPDDDLFSRESNKEILKQTGNIIHGNVSFAPFTPTEWKVESDFVMNTDDPDYEPMVLSARFVAEHDKDHGVTAVMMLLNTFRDMAEVSIDFSESI